MFHSFFSSQAKSKYFSIFLLSLLLFYSFESFFFLHQRELMVSHWSLSNSKSQVYITLHSILADLNVTVVWMLSTCVLFPNLPVPFNNSIVTVPSAPITIGITVTFMLSIFFSVS